MSSRPGQHFTLPRPGSGLTGKLKTDHTPASTVSVPRSKHKKFYCAGGLVEASQQGKGKSSLRWDSEGGGGHGAEGEEEMVAVTSTRVRADRLGSANCSSTVPRLGHASHSTPVPHSMRHPCFKRFCASG